MVEALLGLFCLNFAFNLIGNVGTSAGFGELRLSIAGLAACKLTFGTLRVKQAQTSFVQPFKAAWASQLPT